MYTVKGMVQVAGLSVVTSDIDPAVIQQVARAAVQGAKTF